MAETTGVTAMALRSFSIMSGSSAKSKLACTVPVWCIISMASDPRVGR